MTEKPNWRNSLRNLAGAIGGWYRDDDFSTPFFKTWRRRGGGLVLIGLYLAIFYVVSLSLTAHQIQTRIQSSPASSGNQSFWLLSRDSAKFGQISSDLALLREERRKKGAAIEAIREENISALSEVVGNSFRLLLILGGENSADVTETKERAVERYRHRLNEISVEIGKDQLPEKSEQNNARRKAREKYEVEYAEGLLQLALSKAASLDGEPKEMFLGVTSAMTESMVNYKKIDSRRANQNGLAGQLDKKIEATQRVLESESAKNSSDVRDQLLFFQTPTGFGKVFANLIGAGSYQFVTLPLEVLIFFIVITMGALGGLIKMTEVFLSGEDEALRVFFFRPLFGAVVAIGVYVLLKAGVLVAANATVGDSSGQLNAFFVAFVSLAAGLMSETAISTIRNTGSRFFGGESVTEMRFANGVVAAMSAKKRKAEELYPYLDVPKERVDEWLSERELVPAEAQRVIAAWLGGARRDLFSDIKSSKAATIPKAAETTSSPQSAGSRKPKRRGKPGNIS